MTFTILPGTLVQLADGRQGIVLPPPCWSPGRVLVKVPQGRKRWFKVDECTPIYSHA